MKALVFALLLAAATASPAAAQVEVRTLNEGQSPPPANIDSAAFLAGHWLGSGLGGEAAEIVSPPAGGQIMGAFRHMKPDGAVNFYEFYTIAEKDGSLILRIKHFTPDLVGWEEKDAYVSFSLVAVEEDALYFDGLTFALTGPDVLEAAVRLDEGRIARFRYERRSLP